MPFKIEPIDIKAENKTIMQAISEATRSTLQCGGHGCHDCDVNDARPDHPRCIICRHYPRKCNWAKLLAPKKEEK